MKIITYSDLHLEFGTNICPPANSDADLMVLAGDIITFRNFLPLNKFLQEWKKPVLYVAGNHEYYTQKPMQEGDVAFRKWLEENYPNVIFLQDEAISIGGVNFFGGTMWTNFNQSDMKAMITAQHQMNDYRHIMIQPGKLLKPVDTITFHEKFVIKLLEWLNQDLKGSRVIITHNAPVINPNTKYDNSPLMPAFNSLDMRKIIQKYQPNLWIYGHTHECDNQLVGDTRIISNQLGYPGHSGGFECSDFDINGIIISIK